MCRCRRQNGSRSALSCFPVPGINKHFVAAFLKGMLGARSPSEAEADYGKQSSHAKTAIQDSHDVRLESPAQLFAHPPVTADLPVFFCHMNRHGEVQCLP